MKRAKLRTPETVGSLCTGVGGLDAAVPGVTRWVSETNAAASKVLLREHPDADNLGDITVPGLDPPHVDLVVSGDPCQSMSAAGRQMASKDERFLWPDVMRLVERVRPDQVFFENVQNVVSVPLFPGAAKGSVLAMRLDDLWRAGYAVRWTVLGACAVGAPHHRHRWFLRGRWFGLGAPGPVRVGGSALCGAPRGGGRWLLPTPMARDGKTPGLKRMERGEAPWADLPTAVALLPTPNAREGGARGFPSAEHAARRAADPMRSTNLEDAVALLPTPMADRSGNNRGGSGGRGEDQPVRPSLDSVHALLPTPTTSNSHGNDRNNRGELLLPGIVTRPEVWGKYAEAVALWESITGIPAPEPTEVGSKGGRRLSPALPEWMMGYPPGYLTEAMGRSDALRCAGNGVVTTQARAAWDMLGEGL